MRRVAIVLGICAFAVTLAARQTRDLAITASTGFGAIAGIVMNDEVPPRPVRRVEVRLSAASDNRVTTTDEAGHFVFAQLPAGSFRVSAFKLGFVGTSYGASPSGRGSALPIALAAGQQITIALRMMRGAVITGTITDDRGTPLPNLAVSAIAAKPGTPGSGPMIDGARNFASRGSATTDDRGIYRMFGLTPGRYAVYTKPEAASGDLRGVNAEEVQWAQRQLAPNRPADASGRSAPPAGQAIGVAPVYFPGTTDPTGAATIEVAAGEERRDVNFAVRFVPTARIEGTIVDANGQPMPFATLTLAQKGTEVARDVISLAEFVATLFPRPVVTNGKFWIAGVPPGNYLIGAAFAPNPAPRSTSDAIAGPVIGNWGQTDVSVNGRDITDVVVTLRTVPSVSGRVTFEATSLTPPADPTGWLVMLAPAQRAQGGAGSARVSADGTFKLDRVLPGLYTVRVTAAGPAAVGWRMKSVVSNGRDVADVPLDVPLGTDVAGLVATLTDRPTQISGSIVNAAGQPTQEYTIVVFPTDRSLWNASSRRLKWTRPSATGAYSVADLPAGDYFVAAVAQFETSDIFDSSFLENIQPSAQRLTLADGEKKQQDLKVAGR